MAFRQYPELIGSSQPAWTRLGPMEKLPPIQTLQLPGLTASFPPYSYDRSLEQMAPVRPYHCTDGHLASTSPATSFTWPDTTTGHHPTMASLSSHIKPAKLEEAFSFQSLEPSRGSRLDRSPSIPWLAPRTRTERLFVTPEPRPMARSSGMITPVTNISSPTKTVRSSASTTSTSPRKRACSDDTLTSAWTLGNVVATELDSAGKKAESDRKHAAGQRIARVSKGELHCKTEVALFNAKHWTERLTGQQSSLLSLITPVGKQNQSNKTVKRTETPIPGVQYNWSQHSPLVIGASMATAYSRVVQAHMEEELTKEECWERFVSCMLAAPIPPRDLDDKSPFGDLPYSPQDAARKDSPSKRRRTNKR